MINPIKPNIVKWYHKYHYMKFKRFAQVQGDSTRGKYLVKGEVQNASI